MKMTPDNVLVIVAHPDDEVLGCGGTIAKHVAEGDAVKTIILADGVSSRSTREDINHEQIQARRNNAIKANKILGVNDVSFYEYVDNRMDGVNLLDVIKDVESEIESFQPSIIYTHHVGDVNIDHKVVHNAVITACRPKPGFCVKELLFFEVLSSTEWRPSSSGMQFSPSCFVDIADTMQKKIEALRAYADEMCEFPHPRSIKACECLAYWRGASVGLNAAEAFELGRLIK
jgi:LmbE family N-acetylglucosaminyl deacetylase